MSNRDSVCRRGNENRSRCPEAELPTHTALSGSHITTNTIGVVRKVVKRLHALTRVNIFSCLAMLHLLLYIKPEPQVCPVCLNLYPAVSFDPRKRPFHKCLPLYWTPVHLVPSELDNYPRIILWEIFSTIIRGLFFENHFLSQDKLRQSPWSCTAFWTLIKYMLWWKQFFSYFFKTFWCDMSVSSECSKHCTFLLMISSDERLNGPLYLLGWFNVISADERVQTVPQGYQAPYMHSAFSAASCFEGSNHHYGAYHPSSTSHFYGADLWCSFSFSSHPKELFGALNRKMGCL